MSVCLLAIGDGRDSYHERSWASLRESLPDVEHVDHPVIIDDREHRLGFAGAVAEGWRQALQTNATHIFHVELDFIFLTPIEIGAMVQALDAHPYLVQLALLRGAVNNAERAAGGVIEQNPNAYFTVQWGEHRWREHRNYVTTNPCLWPRWVVERGWPSGRRSEGRFGAELFATDPSLRAAFWGKGVSVDHIGLQRTGGNY